MSSATDTSFALTRPGGLRGNTQSQNFKTQQENIQSSGDASTYFDIGSMNRNRFNYPNPNDFVVQLNYPGRDSTASTAIDPIVGGIPYTGSSKIPGLNVTGTSASATSITLDTAESSVDNFYVNSFLEISGQFRTITSYNGTTKVAVVSVAFGSTPAPGTVYFTRKSQPFFVGTVGASPAPTSTTFAITGTGVSPVNNIYVNSYLRFTSGANTGTVYRISSYNGSNRVVTLARPTSSIAVAGDNIELLPFTRDNASTLLYSGGGASGGSSSHNYYEIELLWVSLPNQILSVGYGGTLDAYPYVYVSLYNEGNRLTNQALISNNPNSSAVLFKVPVDEYFGDTSFITLKNAKTKQVVRFDPYSDIRFTITLPDGTVLKYSQADNISPNEPNPFLQVNALFSLKKLK
jgi:hypothetical protein